MATGKKDAHTVKSKSSKSKKAGVIQVSKVEHEIDEFLENFRRKSSTLDQPQSTELCDSLGLPHASYSSSQCSTDECTDESPDRAYFMPQKPFVKGHRHQHSNTTSESEWGPDCDEEISKEEIIQQLNSRAALIETETAKTEQGTVKGEIISLCSAEVLSPKIPLLPVNIAVPDIWGGSPCSLFVLSSLIKYHAPI